MKLNSEMITIPESEKGINIRSIPLKEEERFAEITQQSSCIRYQSDPEHGTKKQV